MRWRSGRLSLIWRRNPSQGTKRMARCPKTTPQCTHICRTGHPGGLDLAGIAALGVAWGLGGSSLPRQEGHLVRFCERHHGRAGPLGLSLNYRDSESGSPEGAGGMPTARPGVRRAPPPGAEAVAAWPLLYSWHLLDICRTPHFTVGRRFEGGPG